MDWFLSFARLLAILIGPWIVKDAEQGDVIRLVPISSSAPTYIDRGQTHFSQKDYERALAAFTQALRLEPAFAFAYAWRARVYEELKDYRRAVADLRDAIRCDPHDFCDSHISLAWLLATCPNAEIRNGKDAVKYARKACALEEWKDSVCIAVLAAAYAETGNFEKAVKWQRKSVKLADNSYRERMRKVLKLYEHNERYRDK